METASSAREARFKKEQKASQRREARKIEAQQADVGGTNFAAAPLPPQLDVEATIAARKFEINALQKAIKASRDCSSTRAWQLLPLHARRRAASHNVLRLPARLRAKGLAELRSSSTLAKTRSQVRKRLPNHPLSKSKARRDELKLRATNSGRKWLETHLWFSKRFRMSSTEHDGDRWGYVLPEEPSNKGERTDWRAARHKSVLFDASWNQWLRLSIKVPKSSQQDRYGTETDQMRKARKHLETLVAGAGIASARCSKPIQILGCSSMVLVLDGVLHGGNQGTSSDSALCPLKLYVCPSSILTNSEQLGSSSRGAIQTSVSRSKQRQLHRLASLLPPPSPPSEIAPDIEALFEAHPAAVDAIERSLRKSMKRHKSTWRDALAQNDSSPDVVGQPHFVLRRLRGPNAAILVPDERKFEPSVFERRKNQNFSTSPKSIGSKSSDYKAFDFAACDALSTNIQRSLDLRLASMRRDDLRARAPNVYELYGPTAATVLGQRLRPIDSTDPESRRRWDEMTRAKQDHEGATRESILSDSQWMECLSITVHDPRLNLPATPKWASRRGYKKNRVAGNKRKRGEENEEEQEQKLPRLNGSIKGAPERVVKTRRHPHLFADGFESPTFTKGSLDARRSALVIPGSTLEAISRDDCVPIIIVRRATNSSSHFGAKGRLALTGVKLIVPQAWGRAFFQSLMKSPADLRPLGLKGLRGLYREAAQPWYPDEWPSMAGGRGAMIPNRRTAWEKYNDFCAQKAKNEWLRRPPAKRINFNKVGSRWPFGGVDMWPACAAAASEELNRALAMVPPTHCPSVEGAVQQQLTRVHMVGDAAWVQASCLWTSVFLEILHQHSTNGGSSLHGQLLRRPSLLMERVRHLLTYTSLAQFSHPFLLVHIEAQARGNFAMGAEIRLIDGDSLSDQVGSVTTGLFSLSTGKSCGMALMSAKAWFLAQARTWRKIPPLETPSLCSIRFLEAFHALMRHILDDSEEEKDDKRHAASQTHRNHLLQSSNLAKLTANLLGKKQAKSLFSEISELSNPYRCATVAVRNVGSGLVNVATATYIPY